MIGLDGDDGYYVNNIGDVVTENINGGSDAIISTVDYTLPANVEHLYLNGSGLTGTGTNNGEVLGSMGGPNTMVGKDGNDAYHCNNGGDVVIENANQGTDVVWSTVSLTIPDNVEYLFMEGNGLTGTGSSNGEILASFGGANTLVGNGGNDIFLFFAGQTGGNTIADFDGNGAGIGDQLQFVGFGPGAAINQIDATHWDIAYSGGSAHEVLTLSNAAPLHESDFIFI